MIQSVEKDDASKGERAVDHRASDDGLGSCCDVEVKKEMRERLVPLRVINELTATG